MYHDTVAEGVSLSVHAGGDNVRGGSAKPRHKSYQRGQTIWEPGSPDIVGYVVQGAVKLVTFLPDGRTNLVGVIDAPGFFGRIFEASAEFTIEAATDVTVALFERAAFEIKLQQSRDLEHRIHLENLYQLDEAYERITVLACQNTMERLATYLAFRLIAGEMCGQARNAASPVIHIPINRRDFAAYLGTTVETVSRNIQALVRRGSIAVIDSANFRLLRRADLFNLARQDEADLIEMARSRTSSLRQRARLFNAITSDEHSGHRVPAE